MRMKSDIVPVLHSCARGDLNLDPIEWHDMAAVCVVMASGGYPSEFVKGYPINGLGRAAEIDDLVVFHAGTSFKDNEVVNNGGRVLGVTGLGATVQAAIDKAYAGVAVIGWRDVHFRKDIGAKALNR